MPGGLIPDGLGPRLYVAWAALAIAASLAAGGWSPENLTRLLVIAFLGLQLAFRRRLAGALPGWQPKWRFIALGMALAAVVEGFHMISMPVFPALRVGAGTPPARALAHYAVDLAFTLPAYLAIFAAIWWFVDRYRYGFWSYALAFGLAQTLGDGGLAFFAGQPAMLAFLPYPMTNYHAINILPFLAVAGRPQAPRRAGPAAWLAVPAVIAVYLGCGAAIRWAGQPFGLG